MSVAFARKMARWPLSQLVPWAALGISLVVLAVSVLLHDTLFHGRPAAASTAGSPPAVPPDTTPATTVTLPEGKWKTAGIRVAPARVVTLPSEVGVPGRIEANPDRRVDIRPRAPGVVREVRAALGQTVKKGDVLVVLDSPDLGTARLNLRGRQIELATSRTELDWKRQVAVNVASLIPRLRKGVPAATIQQDYADRPLGANRALLMQAYSEFEIAAHEDEKTSRLYKEKIFGEHPAFLAMHTREGAQAKFEAQLEQVKFDAAHEQTLAEQKVRLAEAAVIDAAQRLRILGIAQDLDQVLAPLTGATETSPSASDDVTAYEIVAPFDGTIIARSVAPSQKAEANDVLFTIADLSTVWVMANVPESEFAVIPALRAGTIRVSATAYPGRTFDAKLLTVGAMVDQASRTVPIMAETKNLDGALKLGMFVRIVLDTPSDQEALTVPSAAVVEIEGKDGVFIPAGKDGRTYTFHPVTLGRETGQQRVITSGLAKDQSVVIAGAFFLKSELILQNETEED
jgi:RND family efflux transporter MFP subunit